jgi:hypothetical protein
MALNSSGILIVNFFLDSAKVLTAPRWSVSEELTTVVAHKFLVLAMPKLLILSDGLQPLQPPLPMYLLAEFSD